ncbi:unnamed protein product [Boreogadus saida]
MELIAGSKAPGERKLVPSSPSSSWPIIRADLSEELRELDSSWSRLQCLRETSEQRSLCLLCPSTRQPARRVHPQEITSRHAPSPPQRLGASRGAFPSLHVQGVVVGELYLDDGHTVSYRDNDAFCRLTFNLSEHRLFCCSAGGWGELDCGRAIQTVVILGRKSEPSSVTLRAAALAFVEHSPAQQQQPCG